MSEEQKTVEEVTDDLIPKPPSKLAPRGITSFTVYRQHDETGVSGDGVVIEGVVMATGQCVVHWLYPPPRGGIAIFDSMSDFVKVHIEPHPANQTIITYQDGTKDVFAAFSWGSYYSWSTKVILRATLKMLQATLFII